jgi:glutamate--cysteine ligase
LDKIFEEKLNALSSRGPSKVVWGGRKGIEKESLRVSPNGRLSHRPHPARLGSALTNQYLTTDFSEALLEFVTPAFTHTWEALQFLNDVHQFTYAQLDDELLWTASMPCLISADGEIPLAQYGSSNVARMKTVYRNGLGYRYGRNMQTIAGIHFNYSLPESFWPVFKDIEESDHDIDAFRSSHYLALIRNFRRFGWLVLYLFGASPALCKSFVAGTETDLPEFDAESLFQPFGTSLRMSDLGYTSDTQAAINISLNDLNEYVRDLSAAIDSPEPAYEKIGVLVDGEYRQLSANKLQIENEYYSTVRPKRVAHSGERPTSALQRGGIEYVEIRSMDLNVFDPVGVNQNAMRFMEAFLIYCLLVDSPPLDDADCAESDANHSDSSARGRDPELKLKRRGKTISLRDWSEEILEGVGAVAELIDRGGESDEYVQATNAQLELVRNPDATPSARILADLREQKTGFFRYTLECARQHKDYFSELAPLTSQRLGMFEKEVSDSIARQVKIETTDDESFEAYLERYFGS